MSGQFGVGGEVGFGQDGPGAVRPVAKLDCEGIGGVVVVVAVRAEVGVDVVGRHLDDRGSRRVADCESASVRVEVGHLKVGVVPGVAAAYADAYVRDAQIGGRRRLARRLALFVRDGDHDIRRIVRLPPED